MDNLGLIAVLFGVVLIPAGLLGALFVRSRRRGLLRIASAGAGLMVLGIILFVQFNPKYIAQQAASNAQAHADAQAAAVVAENLARAQAQAAAAAATELAATEKAAEAEQHRLGFHCLSSWDGSLRDFKLTVQAQMREPDSFEHIETRITPVNDAGFHIVFMDYRARNGFGGMNVSTATGQVRSNDCSFTILGLE